MTRASTGLIACVIACSLIAQQSKAELFTGEYLKKTGQLAFSLIPSQSGSVSGTSISLDQHFEQSVPAVNSRTSPPVSYTEDVSIHGADQSFGMSVDATALVPADAAGNTAQAEIFASVGLEDTWFADAVSPAHTLKFTAAWNVNGSLGASAEGEAPPGPFQDPFINAGAGSSVDFFATGDAPNSVTISGGPVVRAFTNETYSNLFTNQSLPNPLSTQSTFPFPSQILITFLIPNGGSLGIGFLADVDAGAFVYSEDPADSGVSIATASFGHTFTWGGVTSVVDADTGQRITDWTLTSASGVDWAHAAPGTSNVPEPATLALAALGGLGVLMHRRRAKTERNAKALKKTSLST